MAVYTISILLLYFPAKSQSLTIPNIHAYIGRNYFSSTPYVRGYRDEIFTGIKPIGAGYFHTDFKRPDIPYVVFIEESYYSVYMIEFEKEMYFLVGGGYKTVETNADRPFINMGTAWQIPSATKNTGYMGIFGAMASIPLEGTITEDSHAWAMIRVSQGFLGHGNYDTDIKILTALTLWKNISFCINLDLQILLLDIEGDVRDYYRGAWGFGIALVL